MTAKKKTISLKERIRRGGPTRTVTVWIGADLDLIDEYERLSNPDPDQATSLAGTPAPVDNPRLAELRALLADYEVQFRLRGLDSRRWNKLIAAHAPRLDADGTILKDDRIVGANMSTFPDALVRATVVSPELDDEDWVALLGSDDAEGALTPGQLGDLSAAAYTLSKVGPDVPFSSSGS